jgi:hypothetical protein
MLLAAVRYRAVVGAAGPAGAGAVSGTIGADGRIVDDPTVVRGAVLSATRGPLQGAHINRTAITAAAAMSPINPPPMPVRSERSRLVRFRSLRPEESKFGLVRFRSSLIILHSSRPERKPLQNTIVPILRCAEWMGKSCKGDDVLPSNRPSFRGRRSCTHIRD